MATPINQPYRSGWLQQGVTLESPNEAAGCPRKSGDCNNGPFLTLIVKDMKGSEDKF